MYNCYGKAFLTIATICFITPLSFTQSDICITKSPCTCQFKNGTIIDITSLGYTNGSSRFSIPDVNQSYTYYYNPCYPFSEVGSEVCKGVAGCQVGANGEQYSLGAQSTAMFYLNDSQLIVNYSSTERIMTVKLVCSPSEQDSLNFIGEGPPRSYTFTLVSKCACLNVCLTAEDDSLSTGSLLVILLFIFVLCYIFGGIIFQKIIRGATGRELFPNYEFWLDFPLLVRDGVVFTCNGCQNEVSYERI